MASPILWPVAGNFALGLGRRAAQAVESGLSFAAELMRPAGGDSPTADAVPAPLGTLPESLERRIVGLAQRIAEKLEQAGIQLTESVALVSDGLAGLGVSGNHPQRGEIEQALASDGLLERDFDRLAREYRDLAAGELRIEVGPASGLNGERGT